MIVENIVLNEERQVSLTAYIQQVGGPFDYIAKRPGILILPGGGYQYCSDREADPAAMGFLKAGFQVFILRYSVKEHGTWPNPLEDYEQAMAFIRQNEEKWNLYKNKIAVLGFSAGGHLAGCAATMAKEKPNAAILGYAVTRGQDIQNCQSTAPDVVSAVDRKTCPCFVFATRDDRVVPIENSIAFIGALAAQGISFESHIYSHGPHGFSTADTSVQYKDTLICSRAQNWVEDSVAWLRDIFGNFGNLELTKPACPAHVSGDFEEYLSLDCTFGYLRKKKEAEPIMLPFLAWLEEHREEVARSIGPAAFEITGKMGMEGFCLMSDNRPFAEILRNTDLSQQEKEKLAKELGKIKNV